MSITRERVLQDLRYCPQTGEFHWQHSGSGRSLTKQAGCLDNEGYRIITINRRPWKAHRLAFLVMVGKLPKALVDHRDGNPSNNAWNNLREATPLTNMRNRKGAVGFSWVEPKQKYQARINVMGRMKSLGYYETAIDARIAYLRARAGIFPEQVQH